MLLLSFLACGIALTSFTEASVVSLGTAAVLAVLGGQTVTNTGPSSLHGNLDVYPGSAATGFAATDAGPGTVNGHVRLADTYAEKALADAKHAYGVVASLPATKTLTTNLGGLTLTPGVYNFPSSGFLTGTVMLDAEGATDALFAFQFGSTFITAPGSRVLLVNGTQACNVFWQVGSSATIDTTTIVRGRVLALTSITVNTGASSVGGLYALNGAVTLQSNAVDARPNCPNTRC